MISIRFGFDFLIQREGLCKGWFCDFGLGKKEKKGKTKQTSLLSLPNNLT